MHLISAINWRERFEKLVLPGFGGIPINHVIRFVLKGFRKGVLVTRASSIAFNLLMALLPGTIFLFALIPFVPLPNFQEELLKLFESMMPVNASDILRTTIVDIVTNRSSVLLLFMFIATVFFSTNGIHAVIHAFVVSSHSFKTRSWRSQRKVSILLLFVVLMMIALAGLLVIFGKSSMNRLVEIGILERKAVIIMVVLLKWILVIGLLFLAISFLYYFAPAKKTDFRFISPGSTLATILFIVTSLGFSAYVNDLGQYNKLYGWIGTLMVIMIWLYLNSIALLIGFELNLSIREARAEDEERARTISCNEETF